MSLSDAKVRNSKPQTKPYKISDGDGMFLLVKPNGSKYWRLRYYFAGRERILALGVYPEVSLGDAREKRTQARKLLAAGDDPGQAKQEAKRTALIKAEHSFETIAREWVKNRKNQWAERTTASKLKRLEMYVFPKIGHLAIADIIAPQVLDMLRVVEKKGALDTAQRLKQICGQVFMYAIATSRAERNPVPDLDGALETPVTKHHAYLKEADLPEFLKRLKAYDGAKQTHLALRFLMLTFVRTIELRAAQWSEIDWEKAEWRIPAERMKMKELHIVPLSKQAIAVLRDLKKISGGREFLFPNQHKPKDFMSENTVLFALYRMGYHSRTTGHGFRSTASTILNENGFRPDVIERQLAHTESNKVRAAYNHAQYLPERRKMMQWWADYLDGVGKKKRKAASIMNTPKSRK